MGNVGWEGHFGRLEGQPLYPSELLQSKAEGEVGDGEGGADGGGEIGGGGGVHSRGYQHEVEGGASSLRGEGHQRKTF